MAAAWSSMRVEAGRASDFVGGRECGDAYAGKCLMAVVVSGVGEMWVVGSIFKCVILGAALCSSAVSVAGVVAVASVLLSLRFMHSI